MSGENLQETDDYYRHKIWDAVFAIIGLLSLLVGIVNLLAL